MARQRKTKREREDERYEADRRAWEVFLPKLAALQSFVEAEQLVPKAPPPDSPGRRYYSNLGFFLQAFNVPAGSNYDERTLYLQFIQRLDAAGALVPGVRQKIEEEFRRAMQ